MIEFIQISRNEDLNLNIKRRTAADFQRVDQFCREANLIMDSFTEISKVKYDHLTEDDLPFNLKEFISISVKYDTDGSGSRIATIAATTHSCFPGYLLKGVLLADKRWINIDEGKPMPDHEDLHYRREENGWQIGWGSTPQNYRHIFDTIIKEWGIIKK